MNKQISKGKWKEIKGAIQKEWGEISDDELEKTDGNLTSITGKIQKRYGESLDKVQGRLNNILDKINNSIS